MSELEQQFRARLDALAERHGVPGVAAGIDVAGEAFFACRGVTHVRHPLAVDPDTLFQIASNSKPFTATLVMQLVAEGTVSLDDPVRKHLPGFRMPDRRYDDGVTLRQLLTHQVGWDGDALFVRAPQPPTLDHALDAMARARQLVPPGAAWTYSNAGFSVAGHLVETLRGKPYEAVLRERILEPLGMKRTCTRADEAIFQRVAMRHLSLPGREPIPLSGGGWQRGWELQPVDTPAGGVISSAADLLRWLRFWLGRADADATAPLDAATRALTCADQLAPWNPQSGHAIGWAVRLEPGGRSLCHGGVTAGYHSFTLFAPELDTALVVLTNSTAGGLLHAELSRWLIGELSGKPFVEPTPLAAQPPLERYAGAYWGSFGITTVSAQDGELELSTGRHATTDGSWQPPPEPPVRARLCAKDLAVVTAPELSRGALVDFEPVDGQPGWLRFGGRISVRASGRASG